MESTTGPKKPSRKISFKDIPELAPWEIEEILKQQEQIEQMHEEEGAEQYRK